MTRAELEQVRFALNISATGKLLDEALAILDAELAKQRAYLRWLSARN
mgnify:CR=1 FL=1